MTQPQPALPTALYGHAGIDEFLQGYARTYQELLRQRPELAPDEQADGDAVCCPCCGGRFTRFERFRHKPEHPWRENALCPVCGSLERVRRLWLQLCEEDTLFAGGRLLHFAPEPFLRGLFTAADVHEYKDCDLQPQRAGTPVDITELPFADASFDWCICSHVLEHVDDDRKALAELARVLRKGSAAWLLAPTLKQGTLVHEPPPGGFTPNDHRREYGLEDFTARCNEAGFAVQVLRAGDVPRELKKRYVLSNHIYRCTRQ